MYIENQIQRDGFFKKNVYQLNETEWHIYASAN